MQHIAQSLLALEAGVAIHFGSLSMVPLRAARGEPELGYLTLAEALQTQRSRVTEVSAGGSVPELAFENLSADADVLLLDGEELVGAKQNRVLNLTLLVGPGKRIVIPVSCVEQGRWRHESAEFAASGNALFAGARAAKMAQVSESLRREGSRRADQGDVWARVAEKAEALDVRSSTGAMSEVFAARERERGAYERAFEAQPGQVGAVFVVHGAEPIVGLELFDSASTFARCLPKILGSFVLEAIDRPSAGPAERCAAVARQGAVELIEGLAACTPERFAALGEGEDLRYTVSGLSGAGLYARGRLVHLSAFRTSVASNS